MKFKLTFKEEVKCLLWVCLKTLPLAVFAWVICHKK